MWTAKFDLADIARKCQERLPALVAEWQAAGARVESLDWRGTLVYSIARNETFEGAIAIRGHTLVLAHDVDGAVQCLRHQLQLAEGAQTLADMPHFRRFAAGLPPANEALAAVWVAPKRVFELVAPKLPGERRGVIQRTMAKLGADQLHGVGYALGTADGQLTERWALMLPQPRSGLLGSLFRSSERGFGEHAARIPGDASAAGAADIGWSGLVDAAVDLMATLDPAWHDEFVAWETRSETDTGVHFRRDLVSILGDRTVASVHPRAADGATERAIVAVELIDAWAFEQAFSKLRSAFPVTIALEPVGELDSYRINLPGLAPGAQPQVAVLGNTLIVARGEGALQHWLATVQDPAPAPTVVAFLGAGKRTEALRFWGDLDRHLPALIAPQTPGAAPSGAAPTATDPSQVGPLGALETSVELDQNGIVWTSRSKVGNPALLVMAEALGRLNSDQLREAVTPAPEPIAAEEAPAWNPAATLDRLRQAQAALRDQVVADADSDGIGEYVDLDEMVAQGLVIDDATFQGDGKWQLDTHLLRMILPRTVDQRETSFALVAWPAFGATGMVYAVMPDGPVLRNDLIAEVAGIDLVEQRDLFVEGEFGADLTEGWHPIDGSTWTPIAPIVAAGSDVPTHSPQVDARKLAALEGAGPAAATEDIVALTSSANPTVAARAAWLLGQLQRDDALATLTELTASHEATSVRRQAIAAIYRIGSRESYECCANALEDDDVEVRTMAAATLGRLRSKQALEPLLDLVSRRTTAEADGADVTQALLALRDLGDPACLLAASAAAKKLGESSAEALVYLFQELSPRLDADEASALIGVLDHETPMLRRYAIQRLGEIGDASAVRALQGRLGVESQELDALVRVSIDAIQGTPTTSDNPLLDVRERALDTWHDAVVRWGKLTQNQRYIVMGCGGVVVLALLGVVVLRRRRRHARATDDALAMLAPSEGFDDGTYEDDDDESFDADAEFEEGDYAEVGGDGWTPPR